MYLYELIIIIPFTKDEITAYIWAKDELHAEEQAHAEFDDKGNMRDDFGQRYECGIISIKRT